MTRFDLRRAISTILLAGLVAGCGGAGASATHQASTTPRPPAVPSTARPTAIPATTSASPTATALAHSPAAAAGPLVPGLPPIDAEVTSAFLFDDTVASSSGGILPVSGQPNGPPFNEVPGYAPDTLLVVLHGPVVVEGVEWYLLTPARFSMFDPVGWAPRTSPGGAALLLPADGACPASPMRVDQLGPVPLANGLPACYGAAEVVIDGPLTCDSEPDPSVAGAPWLDRGRCAMGQGALTVYGLDPELPAGRYVVTGHFDDPAARDCRAAQVQNPEAYRLDAVLYCRRGFVASGAVFPG